MTKPTFSRASAVAADAASVTIPIGIYKSLVDQCARHRFNYLIANGSAIHARILIAKLFEIAEREVVIVSGALTDKTQAGADVYGHQPVIQAAQAFLQDPNAHLSIVLQEGEMHGGNENRFFRSIVDGDGRCGIVTVIIPKKGVLGVEVPHFMIADKSSYRLETGLEAMDKGADRLTAVANFGDQVTATDLRAYFDEVMDFIRAFSS
jgi:hypothetical protein